MPPPSSQEVKVATDVLRTEAGEWDAQSTALGAAETKIRALELGRVEAGLFQLIVSPDNDLVEHLANRCAEGKAAMTEIAKTLRSVADTYDEEDRNSAHRIQNIY